jgi:hypothetical protein
VGDSITVKVSAKEKDAAKGRVVLDTECANQDGEVVVSGTAEVIAPTEKVQRPKIYLPAVRFDDKEMRFREIMGRVKARNLAPISTAIVYPGDAEALVHVAAAAKQKTIVPILVGTESLIRELAAAASVDLAAFEIVPAENPRHAVAVAIRLAREGRIEAIHEGGAQDMSRFPICRMSAPVLRWSRC